MNNFDTDLQCVKCHNIFESMPITLVPCGWVVCSHHLDSDEIKCFICLSKHQLQKKHCVSTKTIEMKYLRYTLEKSLKELENINGKQSGINCFDEKFTEIVNKIDSQREQAKILIEKHYEKIWLTLKDSHRKDRVYELTPLAENIDLNNYFGRVKIKNLNHSLEDIFMNSKVQGDSGKLIEKSNSSQDLDDTFDDENIDYTQDIDYSPQETNGNRFNKNREDIDRLFQKNDHCETYEIKNERKRSQSNDRNESELETVVKKFKSNNSLEGRLSYETKSYVVPQNVIASKKISKLV